MRTLAVRPARQRTSRIIRMGLPPLAAAFGAALLLTAGSGGDEAEAKTPGKTYCFHGTCHRVKTIAETEALVGTEDTLVASHYDSCKRDRHNPCGLTSSGEVFRPDDPDNAASPIYPDGTTLLVWSPATGVSLVLRVNNAGPYWGDRRLDVSRGAAEVLGFASQGVATLKVRVLSAPDMAEATYKKNRTYDPVPGYIGRFASLDAAHAGVASSYAVAALASALPGQATTRAVALAQAEVRGGSLPSEDSVTQLAAVEAAPAPAAAEVAALPEIKPVRMAALIAMREAPQPASQPQATASASAKSLAEDTVRVRNPAERAVPRNSRAYRVAARKKQQREAARVKVAAAAPRKPQQDRRPVTEDGTNDMSVFTRHTHAGMERIAGQEPPRRRAGSRLARSGERGRDRDDG